MTRRLIKTIDIGPYSIQEYQNVKLTKYKETPSELTFLIDYIYNYIGNNIYKILERRLYYVVDDTIIIDIHYYCSRMYNKVALNRKLHTFGTQRDDCKPIIGEPVWLCPPNEKDVHEYNDTKRKEYYKLEKKLNLYVSDIDDNYTLTERKVEKKGPMTITKKSGFKIFKVNEDTLKRATHNKPEKKLYKVVSNSSDKPSSLVIKNIPKHLNKDSAYRNIREMFITFGGISKLTILHDKIDNSKLLGIGFIDFYNSECIDKIFKSNKKFVLNHSVLSLERQKKKPKR